MKTVDYLHFYPDRFDAFGKADHYAITRGKEGTFEGYLWKCPTGNIYLDAYGHNGSWNLDELFTIVEFAKTL